MNKRSNVVMLF